MIRIFVDEPSGGRQWDESPDEPDWALMYWAFIRLPIVLGIVGGLVLGWALT